MSKANEAGSFTGNVFIFYAFDVGEDISLSKIESSQAIVTKPLTLSKYFKNYHIPLSVELPESQISPNCINTRIHNFGVISLSYKIPFADTLDNLRKRMSAIDTEFRETSIADAHAVFTKIKRFVKKPRYFHLRTSYVVVQVDQQINMTVADLREHYGGIIASLLRFETENLSELQKNDILESSTGYYRGDWIIIDIEAAFVYDDDYAEILDLFDFANIQQLELQYYDRTLDQHLNVVYQQEVWTLPWTAYIPFISNWAKDPIVDLDSLKVEISVIIERIEGSVKLAGEVYASETYTMLVDKLDLKNWNESIQSKLDIIKDIHVVYQNKIDTTREDLLSVLIIMLIFIELIVGILTYFK